ncbi:MAG: DNA cytosine methyltransferase [Leptolyngbya sp. DLM2.Bin27]|nr:MAG: DNA cytosine methyltransferase [Leptolyngbya sp. DLM2.Bin27]
MSSRPVAIDLFAGAGGLSLGFEQAGFDVVAAVEVDPIHAAIHQYNFPNCVVLPTSIAGLSAQTIRRQAGMGAREVDIVIGGPPCQGFSLMGQRVLDDPRNRLVREFVRLVDELSPRFFLLENVKGLTVGEHRQVLDELVEAFQARGYGVRTPWQMLNAYNYGVPQNRQRLFLLGARQGETLPDYPMPITALPQTSSQVQLAVTTPLGAPPTCQAALGDLPDAELFAELLDDDAVYTEGWGQPSAYAAELRCLSDRAWHLGYRRQWEPNLLTASARTRHTALSRQRFAATQPGAREPVSRFLKLVPDGVSNTLRAGTDSARGSFTSPRPIHYALPRCITVREMARLHGFPDWFRLHKTKWHGARQVGNAVPPPLARAIATEFVKVLGVNIPNPPAVLPLGDLAWLAMTMTEAAHYWRVEVPIAQRDRKTDPKKTSQGTSPLQPTQILNHS